MITIKRVFKNASWIVFSKLIKAILTLIVTMIMARKLGPNNYGLINYAASLVSFIIPVMKLGLDSTLVHDIINHPHEEGKYVGTSIIANVISGLLCILGIIVFVLFANCGETETIIVCSLYSITLLFQAIEIVQYWFQAKLLSKYPSIAMLIAYIITSLVQILILLFGGNIYLFAISYSLEFLIISFMLLFLYKKDSPQKLDYSFDTFKLIFNKSKYYIIASMMITIFAHTDKIMIKFMIGNENVGYYSAALTCASMFSFVFAAIIDSFRPVIFEKKKVSNKQFEKYITSLYSIIIVGSLTVSLLMTIFSSLIISIMYGSEYNASISALKIIVWYTTFSYLGSIRNIWIIIENKQNLLWKINLYGAILNIVLNLILIPIIGINGAAIASLLTQIFTNCILGFLMKTISYNNKFMINSIKPSNLKNIYNVLKTINKSEGKYERD